MTCEPFRKIEKLLIVATGFGSEAIHSTRSVRLVIVSPNNGVVIVIMGFE